MPSEKHWVDDNHYRVVSDDGRTSWLYEADTNPLTPDTCVEVADHSEEGTTQAYEYDGGFLSSLFGGGRGSSK